MYHKYVIIYNVFSTYSPRDPLKHNSTIFLIKKDNLHFKKLETSLYSCLCLYDILLHNSRKNVLACGPIPPVTVNISGMKLPCSILTILRYTHSSSDSLHSHTPFSWGYSCTSQHLDLLPLHRRRHAVPAYKSPWL